MIQECTSADVGRESLTDVKAEGASEKGDGGKEGWREGGKGGPRMGGVEASGTRSGKRGKQLRNDEVMKAPRRRHEMHEKCA